MPRIQYKQINLQQAALSLIDDSNRILHRFAADGYDVTLRQLYYQLVAQDLFPDDRRWRQIPNTKKWVRDPTGTKNAEPNYKWLGDVMGDARVAGLVDWDHLVDRTREIKAMSHWESPADITAAVAKQYAIDKWDSQPHRVEVWIEKEALAGVFARVCRSLDVPYFACKGYTSLSEMWRAAQRLEEYNNHGQTPIILHFGDHDPSGIDMTRDIADRLALFMGEGINVDRLALNMDQIRLYDPPPNPTKLTDSRARVYVQEYGDESWELDALEPDVLAQLVEDAIDNIRDPDTWDEAVKREEKERQTLAVISKHFDEVGKHVRKQGWMRKPRKK